MTSISTACSAPSWRAPTFTRTRIGWRVREEMNSSARVNSIRAGRPVRSVTSPATSSSSTSCFTPKPPPMRGLMTRMRCTGTSSTRATMRRTWKGT